MTDPATSVSREAEAERCILFTYGKRVHEGRNRGLFTEEDRFLFYQGSTSLSWLGKLINSVNATLQCAASCKFRYFLYHWSKNESVSCCANSHWFVSFVLLHCYFITVTIYIFVLNIGILISVIILYYGVLPEIFLYSFTQLFDVVKREVISGNGDFWGLEKHRSD